MLLLIDNFDSFVYNLARYFERLGQETLVIRNDQIDFRGVRQLQPQAVIVSPGPCAPQQAGCSLDVIRELHQERPILGVCLGHQAIAEALGGQIVRANTPVHGRASEVFHGGDSVFAGVPNPFRAGRYHSLVVDRATLPDALRVTAQAGDGTIMGVAHAHWPVFGVQFHPESILTEAGFLILANFLGLAGISQPLELPSFDTERSAQPQWNLPEHRHPVTF